MGEDRKRRRFAERQHLKMLRGGATGKPSAEAVKTLTTRDRLGQAIKVLVEEFRKQPDPLNRADELRVLLDVAAFMSIEFGADLEQFCNVAAHVFEEMSEQNPFPSGPSAG